MKGENFEYFVDEWWDHAGDRHHGPPTRNELLEDAIQLTVRGHDEDGNEIYWSAFSDDGWTYDELDAEADDAWSFYVG